MIELKLRHTEGLVRKAVRRFCVRVVGRAFLVATLVLIVCFVVLFREGDRSWFLGALGAVIVLAVGFPVLLYFGQLSAALARFRALEGWPVELRCSEQSLSVHSPAGSAEVSWKSVTEVWRFDDFWLLLFSKSLYITLPLSDLPPEAQAFVLERVRLNGGKIA